MVSDSCCLLRLEHADYFPRLVHADVLPQLLPPASTCPTDMPTPSSPLSDRLTLPLNTSRSADRCCCEMTVSRRAIDFRTTLLQTYNSQALQRLQRLTQ